MSGIFFRIFWSLLVCFFGCFLPNLWSQFIYRNIGWILVLVFIWCASSSKDFFVFLFFCCYHLEFRPLGWWVLSNNIQASSNLSHLFLFGSWPTTLILKSNLFSIWSSSLKWSATGFSFLVFIMLSWSLNLAFNVCCVSPTYCMLWSPQVSTYTTFLDWQLYFPGIL